MFAPKIRRAVRALLLAALASLASLASADGHEERARSSAGHGTTTRDVMHGEREDESGHVTRAELQRVQQVLLEELERSGDRAVAEPEFTDRG